MRLLHVGWKLALAVVICLLFGGAVVDQLFASGLDYLDFDQGGVVVNGVAYFTGDGTTIGAFDPKTFQLLTTYSVGGHTYDSSPLVFPENPTIDSTWLVIAHDIDDSETVALNRDTGATVWTSAANQPGDYFFGYSYYQRTDGSRLILAANTNGLHAMSSQTGQDIWSVPATSTGGITPAVDQTNGWIFYQHDGQLLKVNAANGSVLTTADVTSGSERRVDLHLVEHGVGEGGGRCPQLRGHLLVRQRLPCSDPRVRREPEPEMAADGPGNRKETHANLCGRLTADGVRRRLGDISRQRLETHYRLQRRRRHYRLDVRSVGVQFPVHRERAVLQRLFLCPDGRRPRLVPR